MTARAAAAPLALAAVLLVAAAGGSSPAHPDPAPTTFDLLASAHPTAAEPAMSDAQFDAVRARGREVKADSAALTSTTCAGCVGESTALHVIHVPRAHRARLDNVATAWAQECQECTSTALSVQVVVLRGHPTVVPNNRALSLTAACAGCRTSALAFQVVLVADRAAPLSDAAVAELQVWFDEQAAALRASVGAPPEQPAPAPQETPSQTPTPTDTGSPAPSPSTGEPRPVRPTRLVRRDAVSALDELSNLLAGDLDAVTVAADVELSR